MVSNAERLEARVEEDGVDLARHCQFGPAHPNGAGGQRHRVRQHAAGSAEQRDLVRVLHHPSPLDEFSGRHQFRRAVERVGQPAPAADGAMVGLDADATAGPTGAEAVSECAIVRPAGWNRDDVDCRRHRADNLQAAHRLVVSEVSDERQVIRFAPDDRDPGTRTKVEQVIEMRQMAHDQRVQLPGRQIRPHRIQPAGLLQGRRQHPPLRRHACTIASGADQPASPGKPSPHSIAARRCRTTGRQGWTMRGVRKISS